MTFVRGWLWEVSLLHLCCAIVIEKEYQKVYCISDQVLNASSSSSMLQCSGVCLMDTKCNWFSFDEGKGNCTTYSEAIAQRSVTDVSNVVYYSQKAVADCGEPPNITGLALTPGSTNIGAVRLYICPADMIPTEVTCQLNCTWSQEPPCRHPENCADVQICNDSYGDGTYKLYPGVLGGQSIHVYCHDMDTNDAKAYITLFEENHSRNDYSKRKNIVNACEYKDRVGDSTATFRKIRVNLTDLSVDRVDFTFTDTCQESDRFIPGFGEGVGCAWNYDQKPWYNCNPPGFFVINMNGTGLVVDRDLIWDYRAYRSVAGEDTFTRSPDGLKITASVDGFCAEVVPNATMYLKHDPKLEVWGSATEPVCSSP